MTIRCGQSIVDVARIHRSTRVHRIKEQTASILSEIAVQVEQHVDTLGGINANRAIASRLHDCIIGDVASCACARRIEIRGTRFAGRPYCDEVNSTCGGLLGVQCYVKHKRLRARGYQAIW